MDFEKLLRAFTTKIWIFVNMCQYPYKPKFIDFLKYIPEISWKGIMICKYPRAS